MGLYSDIQIMSCFLNIISLLGLIASVLMFVIHYKVNDEIQTKIITILLEKGKDAEQQVLSSNHPEYPDQKIKLDKRIDFDEPVILRFGHIQVLSVGLNINHIPVHPDHNVIYYRVKNRLGNNYWTPIGYPICFKTHPAQKMKILDALRHVNIPTC